MASERTASRVSADQRRAQAVAAGLNAFGELGITTAAVQAIADAIGVSQPYVFRLFGSRRDIVLACIDELEERIRRAFELGTVAAPADAWAAMGAGFRALLADGVLASFWLQASAAGRSDPVIAERCRRFYARLLAVGERLTGAGTEELAAAFGRGAAVVLLQALGIDLSRGSLPAIERLVAEGRHA
jgi:AcrR family transcriptional regulator